MFLSISVPCWSIILLNEDIFFCTGSRPIRNDSERNKNLWYSVPLFGTSIFPLPWYTDLVGPVRHAICEFGAPTDNYLDYLNSFLYHNHGQVITLLSMPWNILSGKRPLRIIEVHIPLLPALNSTHEISFFHSKVSLYVSCVLLPLI